ncbi:MULTISPECIES: hypothetical protein [Herpetosiphon]|uniref:hypothetical protein n=1 Tax=Herpetosiphon TaxID=64 RepID=UPI001364CDDB|nr:MULTISPECIES: hypothetical protein [Herpetosiphon]
MQITLMLMLCVVGALALVLGEAHMVRVPGSIQPLSLIGWRLAVYMMLILGTLSIIAVL